MTEVMRESKQAPESVERAVTQAGGLNRYGEPNFRVVWGRSRLAWVGGKWRNTNAQRELVREVIELRQEPKYVPHDRWHVERCLPPEAYGSPEQGTNRRANTRMASCCQRGESTNTHSRWRDCSGNSCR
jgi:hypothetical protein